ncbi:MAG TPA: NTP transferase domain-containing protein [Vicinamibacterales bacterium]|nr:NTP transferase domain-containing protein [Vicinamibacterales bacterium]
MTDATAIVLAGGKSSRMGTPKALLPFDNEPMIVHIVATLQRLFAEVVVVAAPGQELPAMRVTLVRDDVPHQGPVGGIYYGLTAAAGDIGFVTSCDSAFLNPRLIERLVAQIPQHDVVVPHWQGRFQPLHAVYRRSVLPLLEAQLARGELRPVYLFEKVRTLRMDEDEIRRFDPDGSSFFNMNSPEDYAEALKRWGETGRRDGERTDSICCTVELFGAARLTARTREIALVLPSGSTFAQLFAVLIEKLPVLAGRVIRTDGSRLMNGYACNVNGLEFVRSSTATVNAGDNIAILSADAGG